MLSRVQLFVIPWSPWNSPGQNTGVVASPSPGGLPHPGIEPRSPTGKPKNTEVGSLSLLQQIFPTQESNRCLLHCRRILYQLSHQGSPPMERFQLNSQSSVSAQQNLMGHWLACSRLVPSLLWPSSALYCRKQCFQAP